MRVRDVIEHLQMTKDLIQQEQNQKANQKRDLVYIAQQKAMQELDDFLAALKDSVKPATLENLADLTHFIDAYYDQIKDKPALFSGVCNEIYGAIDSFCSYLKFCKPDHQLMATELTFAAGANRFAGHEITPLSANEHNLLAQKIFTNANDLVNSMDSFSFTAQKKLLESLNLKTLNKIVLGDVKDIRTALKMHMRDKNAYNGDPNHDQSMALLFEMIYEKELANRPDSYLNRRLARPKNPDKSTLAKLTIKLLSEPTDLSKLRCNVEAAIARSEIPAAMKESLNNGLNKNSLFGKMLDQFVKVADPNYQQGIEEEQRQQSPSQRM